MPANAAVDRSAGTCLVKSSGPITIDTAPDLRTLLLRCLESPNCKSLRVDLSEVAYVDTSAIAIVLEALKAARVRRKMFQLTGLNGQPHYMFDVARLLRLFDERGGPAPSPAPDAPSGLAAPPQVR
jgi:anti-sigma B factor antagonist